MYVKKSQLFQLHDQSTEGFTAQRANENKQTNKQNNQAWVFLGLERPTLIHLL